MAFIDRRRDLFSRVSLALLLALLAAGCTAITVNLPPITDSPTARHHNGKVVWRDLLTNTPEASRRFYGELFGWTFEAPPVFVGIGGSDSYMLIRHNGELIGGMVDTNALGKKDNISQWITTISVADIDAAVGRVPGAGGSVVNPPEPIGDRGRMAIIEDSTGALFALIQTKGGDPADSEPAQNGWLWDEVWTGDVAGATGFYEAVLGLRHEDLELEQADRRYRILKAGDRPRAGVLQNPFEGERPVWVNYIRVEDPSAVTARVEGLGGRVLVEAQERPVGGEVALIAGPSGAGVALQTWPLD
jgi:predicted enzyme related to lactoylglutathione lyase